MLYEVYMWWPDVKVADFTDVKWDAELPNNGTITLTPDELGRFITAHPQYNFMVCKDWIAIDTRRFSQR